MQERASSARPAKPLSNQLISQSANQRGALAPLACASTHSAASGHIVAGGDSPGLNLWGSSKPPNF